MINYIKAEIYRVFSRRYLYMMNFICLGFMIFIIIMSLSVGNINESNITDAFKASFLIPISFVAILGFSVIYTDDLNAKTLPTAIGFGIKEYAIVITKLVITMINVVLFSVIAFIVLVVICFLIGIGLNITLVSDVFIVMIEHILYITIYSSIAAIVVYGFQKASPASTIFFLLVCRIVDYAIKFVLSMQFFIDNVGDFSSYTIMDVIENVMTKANFMTISQYILYLFVAIQISIFVFKKKGLEF